MSVIKFDAAAMKILRRELEPLVNLAVTAATVLTVAKEATS